MPVAIKLAKLTNILIVTAVVCSFSCSTGGNSYKEEGVNKIAEDSVSQYQFNAVFDSLLKLYMETPVIFDTSYFVTGIREVSPVPVKMFSVSGCDNKLFIKPEWLMHFSTAEYDFLMSLENTSDADYAAFMADNEIIGEWYRVFESKKSGIMLFQQLGTDINVNWGDVVTETYYIDGKPILFRNRECFRFTKTGVIRRFLWEDEHLVEQRYIFKSGKLINEVVEYRAK